MTSSSAQIYLAIDVLSLHAEAERSPISEPLANAARTTLMSALTTPGWTGRTATCAEYGRPPLGTDLSAERDARTVTALQALVAAHNADKNKVTVYDLGVAVVNAFTDPDAVQ